MNGSDYCFFHDPSEARSRSAASRKGGSQGRRAALPSTAERVPLTDTVSIVTMLSDTIHDVRTGALDPKIANSVGYLCRSLLRAVELGVIEERLSELESAMGKHLK